LNCILAFSTLWDSHQSSPQPKEEPRRKVVTLPKGRQDSKADIPVNHNIKPTQVGRLPVLVSQAHRVSILLNKAVIHHKGNTVVLPLSQQALAK
jgi:hypothetical protein